MKQQLIATLLLVSLLAGCAPSGEGESRKIPSNIIQPEAMAAIIVDIQIAEAVLRENERSGKRTDDQTVNYLSEVFEKHSITREQFIESTRFYEKNIELYDKIYEKVITQLTQRQTELKNPDQKDLNQESSE
ncbi:MAG: DUF4296 domain-containing protein [Bacteroidales bacterium]|nr:DUF4296 domain-containing protein [Bacteroidales bacterium]